MNGLNQARGPIGAILAILVVIVAILLAFSLVPDNALVVGLMLVLLGLSRLS